MRIPPAQTDKAILPGAKSGYVLAVLVLLASLFVVAWYWRSARQREMAAAQADFVASTDETTSLLYQRLGYYELVTRGGVALFGTVARPTRQQWKDYVDGLNIGQRLFDLDLRTRCFDFCVHQSQTLRQNFIQRHCLIRRRSEAQLA